MAQLSTLGVIEHIDIMILFFAIIAVVVIVGAISIRRWTLDYIKQHEHPDRARLRVLWAQLWFYIACAAMFSISEAVLYARGQDKAPAFVVFWVALFAWILIRSVLKIRRCQKESHKHDA